MNDPANETIEWAPAGRSRRAGLASSTSTVRAVGGWVSLFCFMGIFAIGAGYVAARWRQTENRPLAPVHLDADWIRTADGSAYSGYFRKTITLAGSVKHAWVAIAANNSFELTINGNPAGSLSLGRQSRPYQWDMSEINQATASTRPALDLNFPREYQWSDHDNARLPVWLDITGSLRPGRNTFAAKIESRSPGPALEVQGMIETWSGELVPVRSDSTWRAEPVPPGVSVRDWTDPYYDDSHWRLALGQTYPFTLQAPERSGIASGEGRETVGGQFSDQQHGTASSNTARDQFVGFDRRIYQSPFAGRWMTAAISAADSAVCFKADWELPARPHEAYLRVVADRVFSVIVNGQPLRPVVPTSDNQDSGQWIIDSPDAHDNFRVPETVDSNEEGSPLIGTRDAAPFSDPVRAALDASRHRLEHAAIGGPPVKQPGQRGGNGQPNVDDLLLQPDRVPPRSALRDRTEMGFYAYDVAALLKKGGNRIELRLAPARTSSPSNWQPKAAIDASAVFRDGAESNCVSGDHWLAAAGNAPATLAVWQPAQDLGPVLTPDFVQPKLNYRGVQRKEGAFLADWIIDSWSIAAAAFVAFAFGFAVCPLFGRKRTGAQAGQQTVASSLHEIRAGWRRYCSTVFLAAATVPVCTVLLEMSTRERDEHTWFLQAWSWQTAAALTALASAWAILMLRPGSPAEVKARRSWLVTWARGMPRAASWNWLVFVVLVLGTCLRAYQLDFQPLDDDEYASVQAVLAIAKTGAPGLAAEGVYYTRSPLHHYLAALPVAVFGENIWALRLPSVLFGVGAAWLTYLIGTRMLGSRWVGFAAMLLMVLHPYEIFTSHVARFYQQQQFFALLTVYWFMKGFVTEQSQKYRCLSVVGMWCSILSNETSIVLGVQLALTAVLFGINLGRARNVRLLLLAGTLGVWVFLDWTAYQTLCLTRLEGVSLNLEARIQPHFWQPFNLAAMFLGYSRLHLALSIFLVLDLVLGGRTRSRPYLALLIILISGVVLINVLITAVGFRYQYYLIPIWALLAVDSLRRVATRLGALAQSARGHVPRLQPVAVFASTLLFSSIILSWSPWRVAASYGEKLSPDSTGACRYVAAQMRPGDRIMATEPHPHAAYVEIGKVDFDLAAPVLPDYVVLQKGVLVDRNGGAEAVDSSSRVQRIFAENERVWIVMNREKFRSSATDVNWKYPGARMEDFIRRNSELKYRSPFWTVYLWDRSNGVLQQSQ